MWASLAILALEQAVEQQERANHMEDIAMLDPLTGLHNSRALEHAFEKITMPSPGNRKTDDEAKILPEPNSFIYIDLDGFKGINDSEGHAYGNAILCQSAEIIEDRTRDTDMAVRIAGDELGVLLTNASEQEAAEVAQDILTQMNEIGIKASIGVAQIDPLVSLSQNLEDADTAMYDAKDQGGNRVVSYSALSDEMLLLEPKP